MAKIHILESDNNFGYKVVIHFNTPTGVNSVGSTWKSCALANENIGTTILKVGTEPGNITQTEYDSIISGDIIEIVETINPGSNPTNTSVESLADIYINERKEYISRILKYYGHAI